MLFAPSEKGQGLVEYAIIIALIAIVVIFVVTVLGKKVNNTFNSMSNSLTL
jgi:pilus assembly protein Flp/PilA